MLLGDYLAPSFESLAAAPVVKKPDEAVVLQFQHLIATAATEKACKAVKNRYNTYLKQFS